jgi:hypothetical protein
MHITIIIVPCIVIGIIFVIPELGYSIYHAVCILREIRMLILLTKKGISLPGQIYRVNEKVPGYSRGAAIPRHTSSTFSERLIRDGRYHVLFQFQENGCTYIHSQIVEGKALRRIVRKDHTIDICCLPGQPKSARIEALLPQMAFVEAHLVECLGLFISIFPGTLLILFLSSLTLLPIIIIFVSFISIGLVFLSFVLLSISSLQTSFSHLMKKDT